MVIKPMRTTIIEIAISVKPLIPAMQESMVNIATQ